MATPEPRSDMVLLDAMSDELELINIGGAGGRMTETADAAVSRLAREINIVLGRLDDAERCTRTALEEQRRVGADAAHALRTPVAALRAELEEARMNPGRTDLDGLLSRTLGAVDRLQEVIRELRLLADPPKPSGDGDAVDLAALVETELSRCVSTRPLVLSGGTGVFVTADRCRLRRALAIMLRHARRHTGGAIYVRVRQSGGIAELSLAAGPAPEGRMPSDTCRLDTARTDRCLGLGSVWGIAHALDGAFTVQGTPCGGSRLLLRLPLAPAS
ncbi:sensor histidine kinase [Nonomuraea jiangxiensis]